MLGMYATGFDAERQSDVVPAPVLDAARCRVLRGAVDGVSVAPDVREYVAAVVRATRDDPALTLGGSPRASVALLRAARAAAVLDGRDFATPDDVKRYAAPVLRHRIILAPEIEVEGRSADDILAGVLARVPVPQ
jgi:MoxR-like ATPase